MNIDSGKQLRVAPGIRAIASKFSSSLYKAFAQQGFEGWFIVTQPVEPVPKIRCDCPAPGISPIFSLSKRCGSMSKKLWEREQF